MGDATSGPVRLSFNPQLRVVDGCKWEIIASRGLVHATDLTPRHARMIAESRTSRVGGRTGHEE